MTALLPPLLLTGGPAVGKSTIARTLADVTPRTAVVEVDDVRQLIKSGGVAPWKGGEGLAQQLLGVRNAASLARNFTAAGFNVVLADVVNSTTLAVYRRLLPDVVVLRLTVSMEEAWRRAGTRRVFLTDDEFKALHLAQADPLAVDHDLNVTQLDEAELARRVRLLWSGGGSADLG